MKSKKASVRRAKRRTSRDVASALLGGAVGAAAGALAVSTFRDGKGRVFILPPNHRPGMPVPRGGSQCANCMFVYYPEKGGGGSTGTKNPHCWEPGFVAWNGGTKIPTKDARDYCSDWWEAAPGSYERALRSSR